MSFSRRQLIKAIVALSAPIMSLPHTLLAAWPKQAFSVNSVEQAVLVLYGDSKQKLSDKIEVTLDKRVESGDNIPITVSTTLSRVESISVFVEENPTPLAASFSFGSLAIPYVSTRIKLAKSSEVIAVIKTNNGIYYQQQKIKILEGSCI